MKRLYFTVVAIALTFIGCQKNPTATDPTVTVDTTTVVAVQDEVLAIDILLNPDQKMLDQSKVYNDKMRTNYPEGFALDASHLPHITILQAYVKKSDLTKIEEEIKTIAKGLHLTSRDLTANGLYYIPYEDKGLAGITIEKDKLMDFHQQIVALMQPYTVANGTGTAFVPRPDGEAIMQPTVDYVNSFVSNSSGEKYNPHVTIGTAYEDYVKSLKSAPFEKFTFKVQSVSVYQLGELGTAQVKLATIEL